jgi:glucose/arabinose dehydrogenase
MLLIRHGPCSTVVLALVLAGCGMTPTSTPSRTPSPSPGASATSEASASPQLGSGSPLANGPDKLAVELVVKGLDLPDGVTNAADRSGRLFVNEQAGKVRVVSAGGALSAMPFVDLTSRIKSGGERGLLGLAFHPGFATNRRLFVDYTRAKDGATVVSELRASADGSRADPSSERIILIVTQPFANHNGGQLAFGPDGYLYIGLGDGGSGGDPYGNGQNRKVLLGKILRIDVDGPHAAGQAYAIPPDNPYAAGGFAPGEGRPEVWAYGLRNPWRFSFDRATGDLYIGDVGQNAWEEIDRQPLDPPGGANYGWNLMEGNHCFQSGCAPTGLTMPIAEYSHQLGCSVTGGYVYRGTAQPALRGVYIFGDYCSGRLFTVHSNGGAFTTRTVADTALNISSFGEDEAGELYLVDLSGGGLYRVVP